MNNIEISPTSLKRFPKYRAIAESLAKLGWDYITSADLARACDMQEVLVRKDLAQTGIVGRPHHGYLIQPLIAAINRVLGWDSPRKVIMVGAGWLASSVTAFHVFPECQMSFAFAIDTDPAKIGQTLNGMPIVSPEEARRRLAEEPVGLALLAVPVAVAQKVTDELLTMGVRAILNFTPAALTVPENAKVVDANLSPFLAELSFSLLHPEVPNKVEPPQA